MANLEVKLLESGFSAKELSYLNKNIHRYGSSLQEGVIELGNRFRMVISITAGVVMLFVSLVFFTTLHNIITGGITLLVLLLITWFLQPPVITYKAWRYGKRHMHSAR